MEGEVHTERPPSANGLKRRQSELSEQDSKRPRTTPGKESPQTKTDGDRMECKKDSPQSKPAGGGRAAESQDARRKSGVIDEKQRSRRLFGGLLGSLSQTGDRTTKRRQEIESRRKAELQRQDDERLEDKQRRLEQLAEKRKSVKRELEEDNTRRRHDDMLSRAEFLQTTTEPRLYYKPWDLRPEEEDRVDDQVREAKARINDELAEIETQRSKEREANGEANGTATTVPATDHTSNLDGQVEDDMMTEDRPATSGPRETSQPEGHVEFKPDTNGDSNAHEANVSEATNGDSRDGIPDGSHDKVPSPAVEERETTEHDDDHIVEGEEDTVIY